MTVLYELSYCPQRSLGREQVACSFSGRRDQVRAHPLGVNVLAGRTARRLVRRPLRGARWRTGKVPLRGFCCTSGGVSKVKAACEFVALAIEVKAAVHER